jgi:Bacterial Ig domain
LVVTAYSSSGLQSAASNEVSFTAPALSVNLTGLSNGESFYSSGSITLSAAASETGGNVAAVYFYEGSTEIGEVTSAPYTMVWQNAAPGTYVLTAVAYDSAGVSTSSSQVTVTVVPFQVAAMTRLANRSFQLTVKGAVGRTNSLYASPDLKTWSLVTTAVNTTGTLALVDPGAANVTQRFYKVTSN